MNSLITCINSAQNILISGHVRPDGDCAGSCLALWNYIQDNYPDKNATVCLEPLSANLMFLNGSEQIKSAGEISAKDYDLYVILDLSSVDRLGDAQSIFQEIEQNIVLDHHITNTQFGKINIVNSSASSTCEVLYELLDDRKISHETAKALYTGIIHDTGVFKYSCTSERTMQIAGRLMSKGLQTATIIDDSFYKKTFLQNKICGLVLTHAKLLMDDQVILSVLSNAELTSLGASANDTDGCIDQLRLTKGIEVAIFAREDQPGVYKFSLRSNGKVDVSSICFSFHGGGHKNAAGFTTDAAFDDVLTQISTMIMIQL